MDLIPIRDRVEAVLLLQAGLRPARTVISVHPSKSRDRKRTRFVMYFEHSETLMLVRHCNDERHLEYLRRFLDAFNAYSVLRNAAYAERRKAADAR